MQYIIYLVSPPLTRLPRRILHYLITTITDVASNNKKYRLSLRKLLYAALLLALLPFIATHLNTFFNKNTAASLVGGANRAVVKAPTLRYGFVLDSFQVVDSELQENERLADVLTAGGIDEQTAKILLRRTARFCDPAKLEVGSTYLWLNSIRGTNTPEFFVIEPDAAQYIVFDLRDTLDVYQVHRPTDVRLASTAGVV